MRHCPRPAALTLTLLAACGGPPSITPPAYTGPTWAQDVAPLVSKNCTGCHVEGGIAPFALDTYAQAHAMSQAMSADVQAGKMPPWMPGGATPPLLHTRTLTPGEIATIKAWAEAGAPEGDTAHPATLLAPEVIPFGPADVSVDIGADYVPDATLTDDYRCFLVELGVATDRMAAAFQVTPGNRKIVHHSIVTLFDPSSLADLEALDAQDPGPGWQCFGGPVPSGSNVNAKQVGQLGAWVPGVSAVRYPTGTANSIPAHALAVIQVHYNLAGGHDPDRTRLAIELVPAGQEAGLQAIATIPLIKHNLQIPPASTGVVQQNAFPASVWAGKRLPANGEAWIIGVAGHMHLLGASFQIIRTDATGEHPLLEIPRWDFHWQGVYFLEKAVQVKATDTLTIRCTYDNPGTSLVTWGEGTTDEMCLGQLQVVEAQPPVPQ